MTIYLIVRKMKLKLLMDDIYSHNCHPPFPKIKSLNLCPMGSEFHNLRTGHYEHNKNAINLSPTTVIVLKKILLNQYIFTMWPYWP